MGRKWLSVRKAEAVLEKTEAPNFLKSSENARKTRKNNEIATCPGSSAG